MSMIAVSFISRCGRMWVSEFEITDGEGRSTELTYCNVKGRGEEAVEYLCDMPVESIARWRFSLKWINGLTGCFKVVNVTLNPDNLVEQPHSIRFIFDNTSEVYVLLCNDMKSVINEVLTGEVVADELDGLYNEAWDNAQDEYDDIGEICVKRSKRQFMYRYMPMFIGNDSALPERADEVSVREVLWDGTFDKTGDGRLLRYHRGGIPRKVDVRWMQGKTEFSAYFWLDIDMAGDVMERFYGAHRDTKADLIIGLDPDNGKYSLSLYRQGLREPVRFPEEAYQLIVFKNKFEAYRSKNYDRPRGTWLW